jgi:hypothetical protein
MPTFLPHLIFLAGIGQLALILASVGIPFVLGWREETARLRPLTRQIFWTYAGYIWVTNLSFGLISALAPFWLLDGSPLAIAVTAYMAAYWGARLTIQFAALDRKSAPSGWYIRLAEAALVSLFTGLTAVYALALASNCGGLG